MTSKELLKIFSVNTRTICKNKGIKIGELEQTIGVSKGYLSRIIFMFQPRNRTDGLWRFEETFGRDKSHSIRRSRADEG